MISPSVGEIASRSFRNPVPTLESTYKYIGPGCGEISSDIVHTMPLPFTVSDPVEMLVSRLMCLGF